MDLITTIQNQMTKNQVYLAKQSIKSTKEDLKDGYAQVSDRLFSEGHAVKMGSSFILYTYLIKKTNTNYGFSWESQREMASKICPEDKIESATRKIERWASDLKKLGYIDIITYYTVVDNQPVRHSAYILVPLDKLGNKKEAVVRISETVIDAPKVEKKVETPKEKVTAEEIEQAEEEYSFLDTEHKTAMLDIIRRNGYKPGYSEDIQSVIAYCASKERPFIIDARTEDDYKSR